MRIRIVRVLLVAASLGLTVQGIPANAADLDAIFGDPGTTLPNLVPDIKTVQIFQLMNFDLETQTYEPIGPRELQFDTWVLNLGSVSLQLTADDPTAIPETSVSQCVSWWNDRLCRQQRPVGGFGLDPDHDHFHFEEFARYEFRRLLSNSRVDYSRRGLIAANDKVSFCLIDSAQIRPDAFPVAYYRTCGATVQGISAGWADIYSFGLPGQSFVIDGLTDGRYALVVDLDYANRLYETDDTDNLVEVVVELSNNGTQATVVGRNYP